MPETQGLVAWEDLRVGETYWGVAPGTWGRATDPNRDYYESWYA